MSDIIYLVCSTTGESTTSVNGNSNKFHKWTKRADGQWDHNYGRVGTPGVTHVVPEAKMRAKMRDALNHGYTQIEVAADASSGAVNGPAVAKLDVRQKAIDEIAAGDKGLSELVGMLVDRNTREITNSTTLKLDSSTGLFKTDGGYTLAGSRRSFRCCGYGRFQRLPVHAVAGYPGEVVIDASDAPPGYVAVAATLLCGGCKFWKHHCRNDDARCCPSQRVDQSLVIFQRDLNHEVANHGHPSP